MFRLFFTVPMLGLVVRCQPRELKLLWLISLLLAIPKVAHF